MVLIIFLNNCSLGAVYSAIEELEYQNAGPER